MPTLAGVVAVLISVSLSPASHLAKGKKWSVHFFYFKSTSILVKDLCINI